MFFKLNAAAAALFVVVVAPDAALADVDGSDKLCAELSAAEIETTWGSNNANLKMIVAGMATQTCQEMKIYSPGCVAAASLYQTLLEDSGSWRTALSKADANRLAICGQAQKERTAENCGVYGLDGMSADHDKGPITVLSWLGRTPPPPNSIGDNPANLTNPMWTIQQMADGSMTSNVTVITNDCSGRGGGEKLTVTPHGPTVPGVTFVDGQPEGSGLQTATHTLMQQLGIPLPGLPGYNPCKPTIANSNNPTPASDSGGIVLRPRTYGVQPSTDQAASDSGGIVLRPHTYGVQPSAGQGHQQPSGGEIHQASAGNKGTNPCHAGSSPSRYHGSTQRGHGPSRTTFRPVRVASHNFGGFHGGGRRSDIRLKEDIVPLGRLDNGIGIYRFRYKGNNRTIHVGVMAQEVRDIVPSAVARGRDGFLRVDYDRLGLKFMTWDDWLAYRSAMSRTLQ